MLPLLLKKTMLKTVTRRLTLSAYQGNRLEFSYVQIPGVLGLCEGLNYEEENYVYYD